MENFRLNVLIVEDDPLFSVELKMLVEEIGYQVVACVDNSAEALEIIHAESLDFIMMDVDIKGRLSGLEIGERIKHLNIPILYITSYNDTTHYEHAQRSMMIGYLVKPVNKYSLKTTISLAIKNLFLAHQKTEESEVEEDEFILKNYFFFKKKNVYHKVDVKDIVLVESTNNYLVIYTAAGKQFITRKSMNKMEMLLSSPDFMRIHRSYLIQLQHIQSIDFNENVVEILNRQLPINRSNKKILSDKIMKLD